MKTSVDLAAAARNFEQPEKRNGEKVIWEEYISCYRIACEDFIKRFPWPQHRSVTRLGGARGKKQVRRPHVRTCALSGVNLLYWRSTCDIVGTFLRPAVIRRPGNCAPLCYAPASTWPRDIPVSEFFSEKVFCLAMNYARKYVPFIRSLITCHKAVIWLLIN